MTKREIIKTLEHCKGYLTNNCAICQNVEKYPRCNEFLNEIALDLINRQNAEIEKLKRENDFFRKTITENAQRALEVTVEEIEKAKFEAIKEFAEELKNCFAISGDYLDIINIVDNLVKEMTEEE